MIGFKGGRLNIREGVWEELMVSVETEEQTEELELVELEDRVREESRMEEDSDSKNDDQWGSWRGLYFGMFREKQNSKELMQKMKLY